MSTEEDDSKALRQWLWNHSIVPELSRPLRVFWFPVYDDLKAHKGPLGFIIPGGFFMSGGSRNCCTALPHLACSCDRKPRSHPRGCAGSLDREESRLPPRSAGHPTVCTYPDVTTLSSPGASTNPHGVLYAHGAQRTRRTGNHNEH